MDKFSGQNPRDRTIIKKFKRVREKKGALKK